MHSTIDLVDFEAYLTGYWLTDLANFSAYFYEKLEDVNWIGFYLSDGTKLRLGPFCGKVACTEIAFGKGVCGHSFSEAKSVIVDDVDSFPGHIRCDSASKSELVIPVRISGKLVGVLDIDSPSFARFTEHEQSLMEKAVGILVSKIESGKAGEFGKL